MVGISGFQNSSVAQALYGAHKSTAGSIAKLSSGKQFTQASDNVAALSIATQMASELSGMRAQYQNAAMSDAMLQIADGGLNQIGTMLQRQQELAMQASNGSLTNQQRGYLNQEFQSLSAEINRIAGNTNFNGINLLSGGGNAVQLAQTNATAAAFTGGSNNTFSAASTSAVQAFSTTTGGSLAGNAATGQLQFVDGNGNALANSAFNTVNGAVSGKFDNFSISNVSYGTAATVNASINGVQFSGVAADGATSVRVTDGHGTYMELALSNFDLSSDATVNISQAQLGTDFANTSIQRTSTVGANFSGTALQGVTGGAGGAAMLRADDPTASISNFRFAGSSGANNNTLTVQVNGETYTATGVSDSINAGDVIRFERGDGQALQIDFTGLSKNLTNIRTNASEQAGFVNALNTGFSRAAGGGNAGIGNGSSDIALTLGNATATSLYQGQSLDISSAAGAANAAGVLSGALNNVTSLRANIGALQARVGSVASQLQDAMINTESARAALEDTDYAKESSSLVAAQLRARMAAAIQAQTNHMSGSMLNLLG